jgi:hypothetical protein
MLKNVRAHHPHVMLQNWLSSKHIHVTIYCFLAFQVDAMLQKLEKEIDDVDARIGNRWQLLDR